MREYDSLLEVRYGLISDDEFDCLHRVYGTEAIEPLIDVVEGKTLVLALDQASVKTGVCIMDFDTRQVLAVLDIINLGFPTKQYYFQSIYDFVRSNLADANIKYFFIEIPIEHSHNSRTLAVLEAMREFIKDFAKRMPELQRAKTLEVNTGTWRSHFLADDKYKGKRKNRNDLKTAAREEAVARAPYLMRYFMQQADPPDSCDAVGIAYGALEEIYGGVSNDTIQPNKTMPVKNIKYSSSIHAFTQDELLNHLRENFSYYIRANAVDILKYNSQMSPTENCKRYCGSNPGRLAVLPVNDVKISQELKWETGEELKPGQCYYILCWR